MPLEDMIEKPVDPNAPKVFDPGMAQRLIRTFPRFAASPHASIIVPLGEQLQCAVALIDGANALAVSARGDAVRYEREANVANTEVKTMQALLVTAREERDAARRELDSLKAAPAPVEVPKKRGRRAKIVPMDKEAAS